ncbi:hypothetical protein ABFP60_20450 [Clostridioides difficile]
MKISRRRFEYLRNLYPNSKLYLIGEDKYLQFRKPKYILGNAFEALKDIILLPIGFIYCILEFISEMPGWFKTLFEDLKSCSPIAYIRVVDDEVNKTQSHPKGKYQIKEQRNDS